MATHSSILVGKFHEQRSLVYGAAQELDTTYQLNKNNKSYMARKRWSQESKVGLLSLRLTSFLLYYSAERGENSK